MAWPAGTHRPTGGVGYRVVQESFSGVILSAVDYGTVGTAYTAASAAGGANVFAHIFNAKGAFVEKFGYIPASQ
jgi:hypothetical protein